MRGGLLRSSLANCSTTRCESFEKRAPPLFCRFGLEWFYRLITNPKRIRRQIVLPVFAWKVLKEKVILNKK